MNTHNRPCILWGATGQSKIAYDILRAEGSEIIHLFDNNSKIASPFTNIPISYGPEGLQSFVETLPEKHLDPSDIDCIATIGGGNGAAREATTRLMKSFGFIARPLIHHTAIISSLAILGSGVQILAGSIVGPYARIGDYTIINSGANIDHDCIIGRNCHLAPRAALAGEIIVEDDVFIGTNATVLPRCRIGRGAVVGAGAVVIKDVPPAAVVVGNPARPLTTQAIQQPEN